MERTCKAIGSLLTGIGVMLIAYELHRIHNSDDTSRSELYHLRKIDEKFTKLEAKLESSWILNKK
jgi:hypothetical protein